VRLFSNLRHLFSNAHTALHDPDVQGVIELALTVICIATVFYWLVEGWTLLDAAYFSVVTIATVGFGDLTPHTVLGKIFTIVYIFAGIGIFAVAVSTFAKSILRAGSSRQD
jgi:voltage-gated potassium channel